MQQSTINFADCNFKTFYCHILIEDWVALNPYKVFFLSRHSFLSLKEVGSNDTWPLWLDQFNQFHSNHKKQYEFV